MIVIDYDKKILLKVLVLLKILTVVDTINAASKVLLIPVEVVKMYC